MRRRILEGLMIGGIAMMLVAVHVLAQNPVETKGARTASSEVTRDKPSYTLALKVYQQNQDSEQPKVLACPTIQCLADQSFSFRAGGEVKQERFEAIEFGTRVSGKIGMEGKCHQVPVELCITLATPLADAEQHTAGAAELCIVHSEQIELCGDFILGESRVLHIGPNLHCELTVEVVGP